MFSFIFFVTFMVFFIAGQCLREDYSIRGERILDGHVGLQLFLSSVAFMNLIVTVKGLTAGAMLQALINGTTRLL